MASKYVKLVTDGATGQRIEQHCIWAAQFAVTCKHFTNWQFSYQSSGLPVTCKSTVAYRQASIEHCMLHEQGIHK